MSTLLSDHYAADYRTLAVGYLLQLVSVLFFQRQLRERRKTSDPNLSKTKYVVGLVGSFD